MAPDGVRQSGRGDEARRSLGLAEQGLLAFALAAWSLCSRGLIWLHIEWRPPRAGTWAQEPGHGGNTRKEARR